MFFIHVSPLVLAGSQVQLSKSAAVGGHESARPALGSASQQQGGKGEIELAHGGPPHRSW
jgi:hypothetical protein